MLGGRDRKISRTHWSASLPNLVSFRFHERPLLTKYDGEQLRRHPMVTSDLHTYMHVHTHKSHTYKEYSHIRGIFTHIP